MAVDEVLLESAAHGEIALRLYQWSEPTLSLGYFQSSAERHQHTPSRGCPLVRRASGGGAILHDRELTYSFAAPAGTRHGHDHRGLVDLFHGALIEALTDWGLAGRLCPPEGSRRHPREPFLCFARRAAGDLLVGDAKIAGSAQRRSRGAVLQHGSVLVDVSPHAPELIGLAQLANRPIDVTQLAARWLESLAAATGWHLRPAGLDAQQRQRAAELAESRYGRAEWNHRR
jgi:lipoate-protein ligase A